MAKKNSVNPRQMLDVIASVIRDKHIPTDQAHMTETNTNGRKDTMSCQIDTKHEEILLCSFDSGGNNQKLFPYFKEVEGMVSMCDYLLFAEDSQSLFVFSIDLKDTTAGPKQQTLRARTFAEFIIERIKVTMGSDALPKPVYYRQIGIKTTCCKTTTKAYESLRYDKDDYLVLPDYHHFYARQLMDL